MSVEQTSYDRRIGLPSPSREGVLISQPPLLDSQRNCSNLEENYPGAGLHSTTIPEGWKDRLERSDGKPSFWSKEFLCSSASSSTKLGGGAGASIVSEVDDAVGAQRWKASAVQQERADYQHHLALLHEVGVGAHAIMIAPAETGKPECQGFTYRDEQGLPRVLVLVRTPEGAVPEGLRRAVEDMQVQKVIPWQGIVSSPLTGATPIQYPPQIVPQRAFGLAMKVAAQFLRGSGIDPSQVHYRAMQYAMSRYVLNGTTDTSLQWLAEHWDGKLATFEAVSQGNPRWAEKIHRTLEQPFSNDEVMAHLSKLGEKFSDAMRFVEQHNRKDSGVRFHAVGSLTKGRYSAGSDLDTLIETEDPELKEATLRSPYGIIGGEAEVFAIRPFEFYRDRGPHFGTPVYLDDDLKALAKPNLIAEFYRDFTERSWGVRWETVAGHATVRFGKEAGARFIREAPWPIESLYLSMRPYRSHRSSLFIVKHFDPLLAYPEVRFMPGPRLVQMGEALLEELLSTRLTAERLGEFLATPRGQEVLASKRGVHFGTRHNLPMKGLAQALVERPQIDLGELLEPMDLATLLKVRHPVERLMIDFAAEKRKRDRRRVSGTEQWEWEQGWLGERPAGRTQSQKAGSKEGSFVFQAAVPDRPRREDGTFADMTVTDNPLAKIVRGEEPCRKVYEDELFMAFHDIAPKAPVHIVVAPKKPYVSMDDFTAKASEAEVGALFKVVGEIARMLKLDQSGYRVISNHGKDSGHKIPYFHVHLLGGRRLGSLLRPLPIPPRAA